jgi:hypothetical protein
MPESLITIERNERSRSFGTGDQDGPEYASRTRTLDPLIKSVTQPLGTAMHAELNSRHREKVPPSARAVPSHGSGQAGTKLEPDSTASTPPWEGRMPNVKPSLDPRSMRITYRDIRAYVRDHHGFSPRTGWIAHVKQLNGLSLRYTHNRQSTRADICPPGRRGAIEHALRNLGLL